MPPTKQPDLPELEDDTGTTEDDEGSIRRMDPELRVMGQMLRMLAALPDAARARVVAYLADRYTALSE